MSTRSLPLRRAMAASLAGVLSLGLLAVAGSTATAAPGPEAASGPGWSVVPVAGGYQVTLELDEPLPIVSDAPTLTVDGVDFGLATESEDGLTLSLVTSDPDVADAGSVTQTWASGSAEKVEPFDAPVTSSDERINPVTSAQLRAEVARADGAALGTFQYRQDDYDYGDQAIAMEGIGGIKGELTGRIYLPVGGGARPTVILLHGRHTSCSTLVAGTSNPNRWPCVAGQIEVPSYKGYDGTAQTLATQGYAVVSISANAINANDAQLTADNGALARGELVLDTLRMIEKWNAGAPATYEDAARNNRVVGTDEALDVAPPDPGVSTPDLNQLDAVTLQGRFDLSNVGLMGHSRGGEGVTSAVTLNQALDQPFGIKSVLPLAPVDFSRMAVGDVPMLTILPYCDGDVSNQQGQHFPDDSRYNFTDDVLRSTVWVMGANHNFFNTVWTPGKYPYSVSDDWGVTGVRGADTVCSSTQPTNIRLSPDDQYNVGTEYMAAWFRLTLGGGNDLLPYFDGSIKPTMTTAPSADIRVVATAPTSGRLDIERFTEFTGRVRPVGSATVTPCASTSGRTSPQQLPACATANTVRGTGAMPHWTPASYAPNVPASPMTRFLWTDASGSVRIPVPAEARNAAAFERLEFKTAPDEAVTTGTDMTVTVTDGAGGTWSSLVSALNPLAVRRMPISGSTTLNKIVLQQVSIPVASMTTINTADIREVRFTAAPGADNTATTPATTNGGVYLSDLALARSAVGTAVVREGAPTINVAPTTAEEGSGTDTKSVAVVLSKASNRTTSAWLTVPGSTATGSRALPAAEKVTFAPGETCKAVAVPTLGDRVASTTAGTSYKTELSNQSEVVYGAQAFGTFLVREDDGTVPPNPTTANPNPVAATPLAPVGQQGDVCAEYAAASQTLPLEASTTTPAPATVVTLTGRGFRAGESVTITEKPADPLAPATTLGTLIADADGRVTIDRVLLPDAALGVRTVSAVGAGSARTETVNLTVTAAGSSPAPATPATPTPGTTTPGSTGAAAGTSTSRVSVTSVRVKKLRATSRVRVAVRVAGTAGAAVPTGQVTIRLGKKTATAAVPQSGVVRLTLRKKRVGGRVLATYSGDALYAGAAVRAARTR